jgi:hypothetical protein
MEKRVEVPLERKDKEDQKVMKPTIEDKDEQRMCGFVVLFVIIIGYKSKCISPFAEW